MLPTYGICLPRRFLVLQILTQYRSPKMPKRQILAPNSFGQSPICSRRWQVPATIATLLLYIPPHSPNRDGHRDLQVVILTAPLERSAQRPWRFWVLPESFVILGFPRRETEYGSNGRKQERTPRTTAHKLVFASGSEPQSALKEGGDDGFQAAGRRGSYHRPSPA